MVKHIAAFGFLNYGFWSKSQTPSYFITVEPTIIREKILPDALVRIIREGYYGSADMAKIAVDVGRGMLAIGGEWHSDAEEILIEDGSAAHEVWGANFYPWKKPHERLAYISLINLKPLVPHRTMEVTDTALRKKIHEVVTNLLLNDDETLPTE